MEIRIFRRTFNSRYLTGCKESKREIQSIQLDIAPVEFSIISLEQWIHLSIEYSHLYSVYLCGGCSVDHGCRLERNFSGLESYYSGKNKRTKISLSIFLGNI